MPAGDSRSTINTLPVIPRCRMAVPSSAFINKYLARRSTEWIFCPSRLRSMFAATGQRRRRSRTMTFVIDVSTIHGSMPRRLVSTSGNSGMLYYRVQRRCRTSMYKKARVKAGFSENRWSRSLFDLGFLVDDVLTDRRIVLFRLQLFRMELLVLRRRVVVARAGTGHQLDLVAITFCHVDSSVTKRACRWRAGQRRLSRCRAYR